MAEKKEKTPFTKRKIVKLLIIIILLISTYNLYRVIEAYSIKKSSDDWYQMECDKVSKNVCKQIDNYDILNNYKKYRNKYLIISIICFLISISFVYSYRSYPIFLIMLGSSIMFNTLSIVICFG